MTAYRMLGSLSEADDAVQQCWLRVSTMNAADVDAIKNMGGWLTMVVSRLCLDMLRQRKARREQSWDALPAEVAPAESATRKHDDPEYEAILAESVGLALLVVMDNMNPDERVAFVLHDVFQLPFNDIAEILNRSVASTRQLASRARRRVRGAAGGGHAPAEIAQHRAVVDAFLAASRAGNFEKLLQVLHPDVVLHDERRAARGGPAEIRGAHDVARQVTAGRAMGAETVLIDGEIGVVVAPSGRLQFAVTMTFVPSAAEAATFPPATIATMNVIADPARLRRLEFAIV